MPSSRTSLARSWPARAVLAVGLLAASLLSVTASPAAAVGTSPSWFAYDADDGTLATLQYNAVLGGYRIVRSQNIGAGWTQVVRIEPNGGEWSVEWRPTLRVAGLFAYRPDGSGALFRTVAGGFQRAWTYAPGFLPTDAIVYDNGFSLVDFYQPATGLITTSWDFYFPGTFELLQTHNQNPAPRWTSIAPLTMPFPNAILGTLNKLSVHFYDTNTGAASLYEAHYGGGVAERYGAAPAGTFGIAWTATAWVRDDGRLYFYQSQTGDLTYGVPELSANISSQRDHSGWFPGGTVLAATTNQLGVYRPSDGVLRILSPSWTSFKLSSKDYRIGTRWETVFWGLL